MLVKPQSCILNLDLWVSLHAGKATELYLKSRSVGLTGQATQLYLKSRSVGLTASRSAPSSTGHFLHLPLRSIQSAECAKPTEQSSDRNRLQPLTSYTQDQTESGEAVLPYCMLSREEVRGGG